MTLVYDRERQALVDSNPSITLDNLPPIAANRLLGRISAGLGSVEVLTVAEVRRALLYSAGANITIVDGEISATGGSGGIYAPMVLGGFHDDVLTTSAAPQLPRLVCLSDGRLMMTKIT